MQFTCFQRITRIIMSHRDSQKNIGFRTPAGLQNHISSVSASRVPSAGETCLSQTHKSKRSNHGRAHATARPMPADYCWTSRPAGSGPAVPVPPEWKARKGCDRPIPGCQPQGRQGRTRQDGGQSEGGHIPISGAEAHPHGAFDRSDHQGIWRPLLQRAGREEPERPNADLIT